MIAEIISKNSFLRGGHWFAAIFSLLGIVALFVPFDGFFDENYDFLDKLLTVILLLLASYLIIHAIAFLFHVLILNIKKKFFIAKLGGGKELHIVFGDILDNKLTKERNNIVISFNRCFDTQVDDYLIRQNSLHGQLVNKLISTKKYTKSTLRKAIEKSLNAPSNITYKYEEIK